MVETDGEGQNKWFAPEGLVFLPDNSDSFSIIDLDKSSTFVKIIYCSSLLLGFVLVLIGMAIVASSAGGPGLFLLMLFLGAVVWVPLICIFSTVLCLILCLIAILASLIVQVFISSSKRIFQGVAKQHNDA